MSETNKDITSKPYGEVIRAAIVKALEREAEICEQQRLDYQGAYKNDIVRGAIVFIRPTHETESAIDAMLASGDLIHDNGLIRLPPELTPRERLKRSLMGSIGQDADGPDADTSISYLLKVYPEPSDVLSILGEMLAAGEIAIGHYKSDAFVRLVAKAGE